jgi:hypothetical protein
MLRALLQMYRRIITASRRSSRYRPERHYMRGAGPASLRKTGAEDDREPGVRDAESARHKEPA